MVYRPDLDKIEQSYSTVLKSWKKIDDELDLRNIGRKDTAFDEALIDNMLSAWDYVDYFIRKKDYDLLSAKGGPDMLEVNHRVHYGENYQLRREYQKAIDATITKFSKFVPPMREYYKRNMGSNASVNKVAAEIFIAIVGSPQLYFEGNHRSGSIVASWINLAHDRPPFVLTVDNAISYFGPAQEIKKFNKRSIWRSMTKLPKYKKDFKLFWKHNCDMQFVKK